MVAVSFEQISETVGRLVFSDAEVTQWDNVRFTLERDADGNIVALVMLKTN